MATGAYDMECSADREEQLERIKDLQGSFGDHVEWLIASGVPRDRAMELASSDPPGVRLERAQKCAEYAAGDQGPRPPPPSDGYGPQILSYAAFGAIAVVAAVLGAAVTISRSEKKKIDGVRSASWDSIMASLAEIGEILKKPREYTHSTAPAHGPAKKIPYVNQKISAAVFESIINSGSLVYLPAEMQKIVEAMHFAINEHNGIHSDLQSAISRSRMERLLPEYKEVVLDLIMGLAINEAKLRRYVAEFTDKLDGRRA